MAAKRLQNRKVLITGASSGIGKSIATQLVDATDGHISLILAARRLDLLDALASDLRARGAKTHTLQLDVSDRADIIESKLDGLPEDFKQIDTLINNAGFVLGTDKVGSIAPSEVDAMFAVNVLGLIHTTQHVVRRMLNSRDDDGGRGDVVNIGSIAGREAYPGGSVYCATKSAVASFTSALRKELISTRVRVIQVDPGQVETNFSLVRMRGDEHAAKKIYEGVEPLTPDDIAEVVVFALGRRENVVMAETLVFHQAQAGAGGSNVYKKPVQ